MAPIHNIALAGKGLLGTAVLNALVDAGFKVTVLSRSPESVQDLPTGVKAVQVDYSSVESLAKAFKGHDAVVVTITSAAIPHQKPLIDAAVQAGVQRFVPADYGSITTDPGAGSLVIYGQFIDIQNYLAEKTAASSLEWTIFSTGPFLEFFITGPFAADLANTTVEYVNGGNHKVSTTSIATIGKAIAASFKQPEQTKNRVLHIQDLALSQKDLVARAKKHSAGKAWKETEISSDPLIEDLNSDLAKKFDHLKFLRLLRVSVLSGKYASGYKQVDNDVLGIGSLPDSEVEARIAAVYK